jgi:hypothetical protein
MKTSKWIAAVALCLSAAWVGTASAVEIKFTDSGVPLNSLGDIKWDGTNAGTVQGINIPFTGVEGLGTAANTGVSFACTGCMLNFSTGSWSSDAPGGVRLFSGGGFFTVTGSIAAAGIANEVILTGNFVGTSTVTPLGALGGLFAGPGLDTKNQKLLDFFQVPASLSFQFASTNISTNACVDDGGARGFDCKVTNADITNTGFVPVPAPIALLGLGLVALGMRRRS